MTPMTPITLSQTLSVPPPQSRPAPPPPVSAAVPAAPTAGNSVIETVVAGQAVEPIKRVLSWAIDLVIVLVASTLAGSASGAVGAIVLFVGGPMYYLAAVGHFGTGTVGHRLLGLQVVDSRSGGEIGLLRAGLRLSVAVLTVVPWGIASLFSAIGMFRGGRRLAWHDHASQAVVSTRHRAARFAPPVSSPT
ncbi:MAG: RDD family protein [Ilumatobacteraceae bacterium]